jgi:hypothetical protein
MERWDTRAVPTITALSITAPPLQPGRLQPRHYSPVDLNQVRGQMLSRPRPFWRSAAREDDARELANLVYFVSS